MALDRPIHAAETADGTTAPAVAAPGSAVRGGLAQMPPHFGGGSRTPPGGSRPACQGPPRGGSGNDGAMPGALEVPSTIRSTLPSRVRIARFSPLSTCSSSAC